jgi:hypothetical protein
MLSTFLKKYQQNVGGSYFLAVPYPKVLTIGGDMKLEQWSLDAVEALAPDVSSIKAASKLKTITKWQQLAVTERVIWGLCKGSGQNPYKTQIDMQGPAFKCSCPSRKFPCKHALALFQLAVADSKQFAQDLEQPDWVKTWLSHRDAAKSRKENPKQVDKKAQAKRKAKREANRQDGFTIVSDFLEDMMALGLADFIANKGEACHSIAARMIDAGAPGIANRLKKLALLTYQSNREIKILHALAELNLLIKSMQRIETISDPNLVAEIKQQIGLSVKDEMAEQPAIRDKWLVLGSRLDDSEQILSHRVWLLGENHGQFACLLNFAHPSQRSSLPIGWNAPMVLEGTLRYYPSTTPIRANIEGPKTLGHYQTLKGANTLNEAYQQAMTMKRKNPWLATIPVCLKEIQITAFNETLFVSDSQKNCLPLEVNEQQALVLLAQTAGKPKWLFAEFDGDKLMPLTFANEQAIFTLESIH